ncbi:unnamed protein product [Ectocarpus sp. 13 AM-2016]
MVDHGLSASRLLNNRRTGLLLLGAIVTTTTTTTTRQKQVLRTRSTSGMYLPLSITIAAAAALWATYGYLTSDWFVAAPQSVGFLAGLAQLSLFLRFGIADNNQPSEGQALEPNGQSGNRSSPDPGDGANAGVPAAAAGSGEPESSLSDGSKVRNAPSKSGKSPGGEGGRGGGGRQLREPLITGS